MDVWIWTQVSSEASKISKPLLQVKLAVFAFKLDTALATTSVWQTPSAVRYTAAPCHVFVASVQMVLPLLARQCPDSSELGTWTHSYLANVLL